MVPKFERLALDGPREWPGEVFELEGSPRPVGLVEQIEEDAAAAERASLQANTGVGFRSVQLPRQRVLEVSLAVEHGPVPRELTQHAYELVLRVRYAGTCTVCSARLEWATWPGGRRHQRSGELTERVPELADRLAMAFPSA